MIPRSAPEKSEYGCLPSRRATCVWTVPFQLGGPHVSSEVPAEIPRESARPGSSARTLVIRTVSLSMEPARQATRSAFDSTLCSQSRCRSDRASPSNRKTLGIGIAAAPAPATNALRQRACINRATASSYEPEGSPGVMATPHGIFPAGIFLTTCKVSVSSTLTSFEGPFAV